MRSLSFNPIDEALGDGISPAFKPPKPQKEPEEPLVQLAGEPPKSDTKPPVVAAPIEDKSGLRTAGEAEIAAEAQARKVQELKSAQAKGETAAKEAREAAVYAQYKPQLTAPYETFKPTGDTASGLASLGLMIGMLGAMGGKKGLTSATGAMNAIAGMMTGYQEGNKEKYERERKNFEENLKIAQQNHALVEKEFERAVKYAKYDLTGATNAMIKSSLARGDTTTANSLETRGLMKTSSEWSQAGGTINGRIKQETDKMIALQEAAKRAKIEVEARKAETKSEPLVPVQTAEGVVYMPRSQAEGQKVGSRSGAPVSQEGTYDPETRRSMARQYLSGDKSVLQNFGTSRQAQIDKALVRKEIYTVAKELGKQPEDIAGAMAEFEGYKASERTLGTAMARIGMFQVEAESLIPPALEASNKVKRFDLIPLNKLEQKFDESTSDPDLKRFAIANNALLQSYVKAITPVGAPTDLVRRHAYGLLSTVDGQAAYEAGVKQLQIEMDAAAKAPGVMKKRIEEEFSRSGPKDATGVSAPTYTDQNIINDDLKKKGYKAGDRVNVIFNGKPEVWEIE